MIDWFPNPYKEGLERILVRKESESTAGSYVWRVLNKRLYLSLYQSFLFATQQSSNKTKVDNIELGMKERTSSTFNTWPWHTNMALRPAPLSTLSIYETN